MSALLTTQQRSGPSSPVSKLINTIPFPLGLTGCRARRPCGRHVEQTITAFGGIRRGPTIAAQLEANLESLENRGWGLVLCRLSILESGASRELERETARYLDAEFKGLGPKQARNVLQMLGLTRHETPIDSRITKWLKGFGFPIELSGMALSEVPVYEFVLDGFQVLCERAGVLPCLMDAAIFASFDGSEWDRAETGRW